MCVLNSVFIFLLQAAVGNHPVQEVFMSRDTKKLMIRLSDSCERSFSPQTPRSQIVKMLTSLTFFQEPLSRVFAVCVFCLQVSANQSESWPCCSSEQRLQWQSGRSYRYNERWAEQHAEVKPEASCRWPTVYDWGKKERSNIRNKLTFWD